MPELSPAPVADDAFRAFALQLTQILEARADVHEGLMVIFAPVQVERGHLLCERLGVLLDATALAEVRWIVIDPAPPALFPVAEDLKDRAIRLEVRANGADADRALKHMLDTMSNAPKAAPAQARMGGAWPRGVVPPPRRARSMMRAKLDELFPNEA